MSNTIRIIPNVALEKLRQRARKLKSKLGIPHHQALEQSAIQSEFSNWHQVVNSAKLTSITEKAIKKIFGLSHLIPLP